MRHSMILLVLICLPGLPASAAITITGVADKTKYTDTVTFTVNADPAAANTTAELDGEPLPLGTPVSITSIRYHELKATSFDAGGTVIDTRLVRFIVRSSARNGSEDGIPVFTPDRAIDDAPTAFSGGNLRVIAPSAWPSGIPLPVAFNLVDAAGDPLRLNGKISLAGWPGSVVPMRRGWASANLPAFPSPRVVQAGANLAGLGVEKSITILPAEGFTETNGILGADTLWPPHSRIHVTGSLTVAAGATLSIGEGTIVLVDSGNGTGGSAAELIVHGNLVIQGSATAPIVFTADTPEGVWGGIELPSPTSSVVASHAIFTRAGEDPAWFSTHSGYSTHKSHQALFLLAGSGSGISSGAELHLTDCFIFDLAGQAMNSRTNTTAVLQGSLIQRAVTGGQLNGSAVTMDRSALLEFPGESGVFTDADNDALYFTNGSLSITRSTIGFTKDDGIDSGGNGGDNPFTPETDVTTIVSTGNWFEGSFHEANSLSGTRNVLHTNCVFFNCGQGVEAGYSASATGDGPNATIEGCLFAGNMVGVRWGDNYGSGYNYNGTMEVRNSLLLYNNFRDAFSGQWHPTQANAWIYQTTNLNSHDRAFFSIKDTRFSRPDATHHPDNDTWTEGDAAELSGFMPVPGSLVGVGVSSFAPRQETTASYTGNFTIRLSTFSSRHVNVQWKLLGRTAPDSSEFVLHSGSLHFAPGEVAKALALPLPDATAHEMLRLHLFNPVNAEITGEAWFFKAPSTPSPLLIPAGDSGWRCRTTRSDPPADWKSLSFDEGGPSATEWNACTLPAGFSYSGLATTLGFGTSGSDKTRTYYFRKKFTVGHPEDLVSLTLRLRRDDGAVVWMNNASTPTVISADGPWSGPFTYTSLAPNATNTSGFVTHSIPPSTIVPGENILAIELHQTSITSSDLLLDCELLATWKTPLELLSEVSADQHLLRWFSDNASLEQSEDLDSWRGVPGSTSPFLFTPEPGKRFFRLRQ